MLSYQLDLVSIKANNFEVYSNDNLKKDYIKGKVTKLYNDGWFDEFFNKIYNDDNKNYMKFEAAYLLGISLKYLQTNELDSKIKELISSSN